MSSFFMRTRREFVSCRIPVFAAALDREDPQQVEAWRNAKYTITSPNSKESVDFYIDRAVDSTGAYEKGELYPVNATQLVVSTRTNHPSLAEFRVKSLDWENYTRPSSVEIIYEEKENVDLNVTVSIGKLCTRLSCPQQEESINPHSTVVFSPVVKRNIDCRRETGGIKTRYNGYKRYSAVISIPHADSELLNACTSSSLPDAASGIESASTSYNVDTDAFTVNAYFEQVSNNQYAVAVGQHVGFLTFKFETEFSSNVGPSNTTILAAHLSHIFKDKTNAQVYVPSHIQNYNSSAANAESMLVRRQCKVVRRGGRERLVEGMIKVPLSDGMFSAVPRPFKHIPPGSDLMMEVFAKEWKRRSDPKAAEYERIMSKVRRHEDFLSSARKELATATKDEAAALEGEMREREDKLARKREELSRLAEESVQQFVDATPLESREIATSLSTVGVYPASAGSFTGDFLTILRSINEGRTVSKREMLPTVMQAGETSIGVVCASSPMSGNGIAVGLNSADPEDPSPVKWAGAASALIIPAAFMKNEISTAAVGRSLLTEALYGTEEYANETVDYGKGSIKVFYDYADEKSMDVETTKTMPVANMKNPYYSVSALASNGMLKLIDGVVTSGVSIRKTNKEANTRKKVEHRKAGEQTGVSEAYAALKKPVWKRNDTEKVRYCAATIPEDVATQANRTDVVKLNNLAASYEYVMNRAFVPKSQWTISNSDPESVNGIILSAALFSGRALLAVVVHIKDDKGAWVSLGENGQLLDTSTDIGNGTPISDLISEAWSTSSSTLLVSPVPVYDRTFSDRCVRLSPIGDSAGEMSCHVTAVALGENTKINARVVIDGVESTEERYGGVLFLFSTYFSNSPVFTTSLPKQMPDAQGNLVDIKEDDSLFLYHMVHNSIDFTGSDRMKNDWTAGATVLGEIPAGFPDGKGALAYPEQTVILDVVTELFTNFNADQ